MITERTPFPTASDNAESCKINNHRTGHSSRCGNSACASVLKSVDAARQRAVSESQTGSGAVDGRGIRLVFGFCRSRYSRLGGKGTAQATRSSCRQCGQILRLGRARTAPVGHQMAFPRNRHHARPLADEKCSQDCRIRFHSGQRGLNRNK